MFVCHIWLSLKLHLNLEFITEHQVQDCDQFNVSEPGVILGECLIITGMVKKDKRVGSEPYIILNGAPAKLSGAGGMPWKVSALS